MACRLKKFGINYEIYDLDSPVGLLRGPSSAWNLHRNILQRKVVSRHRLFAFYVLISGFYLFCMLRCVSNWHPPHPLLQSTPETPLATRCALLGVLSTPESCLAWPAYVSCLPAEISFLSISLLGLLVFPAAASLAGLAFSGWAFAFALLPTVHWPCNFLFTFLTPKISLSGKRGGFSTHWHAQRWKFWCVGELGEILMPNGQIFWFVCFSFELFSQHTFTGRPA